MNDTIYRQAAIRWVKTECNPYGKPTLDFESGKKVIEHLEQMPSAEKPFKLPKIYVADGYDTVMGDDGNVGFGMYVPDENQIYVAGDVEDEIRARALLHELCHWVQAMCGRPFDEDEANEFSKIVYDALPSAQPRMKGRWTKGINENGVTTSLFCSECNYENKHWYEWNYCPNCGADMRRKSDEQTN